MSPYGTIVTVMFSGLCVCVCVCDNHNDWTDRLTILKHAQQQQQKKFPKNKYAYEFCMHTSCVCVCVYEEFQSNTNTYTHYCIYEICILIHQGMMIALNVTKKKIIKTGIKKPHQIIVFVVGWLWWFITLVWYIWKKIRMIIPSSQLCYNGRNFISIQEKKPHKFYLVTWVFFHLWVFWTILFCYYLKNSQYICHYHHSIMMKRPYSPGFLCVCVCVNWMNNRKKKQVDYEKSNPPNNRKNDCKQMKWMNGKFKHLVT